MKQVFVRLIFILLLSSLDQLLADLQNVSQRARRAHENSEGETRLEPMVLNRNLPLHRNQALNLIRPDSIAEPESVNELNQLLDALGKAKETMKKEKQRM